MQPRVVKPAAEACVRGVLSQRVFVMRQRLAPTAFALQFAPQTQQLANLRRRLVDLDRRLGQRNGGCNGARQGHAQAEQGARQKPSSYRLHSELQLQGALGRDRFAPVENAMPRSRIQRVRLPRPLSVGLQCWMPDWSGRESRKSSAAKGNICHVLKVVKPPENFIGAACGIIRNAHPLPAPMQRLQPVEEKSALQRSHGKICASGL